jgi:hypothetical protein
MNCAAERRCRTWKILADRLTNLLLAHPEPSLAEAFDCRRRSGGRGSLALAKGALNGALVGPGDRNTLLGRPGPAPRRCRKSL